MFQQLPSVAIELIRSARLAEFATISATGVPIDTVCLYFYSENRGTLDLTTGLSYPAKAERARRNPKVGLLIEGGPNDPVISIAGMAAVRDADVQANVIRYLAENGYSLRGDPGWPLAQKAVWYWSRIFLEVTPARVLWWDNPAAMNLPPHRLEAPAGTQYPASDPAPGGAPSKPPIWPGSPWRDLANEALARNAPGHLSVISDEGYPMPIRAEHIEHTDNGFSMSVPLGVPWGTAGKASLSFQGLETFIGEVTTTDGQTSMKVERALPILPSMNDAKEIWEPSPENKEKLLDRLRYEMKRRNQPIPTVPLERPEPTASYKIRMARSEKPTAPSRT